MNEPSILTFTLTYAATLAVAALMFLGQVIAFTVMLALAGTARFLTYAARVITRRRHRS